jgi:predicted permease
VVDLREVVVGDAPALLRLLLAAVVILLLVTCANIANLLLMRASERRHELAVRTALGARQGRLLGQFLTESVVLALLGGALGLGLSLAFLRPLVAFLPPEFPRTGEIRVDGTVFTVAALVSLGTGVLMGVIPALRASRGPSAQVLSDAGTRTTVGRADHRMQRGIVIAEVALSFVLLTAAGLLTRSLERISAIDLGFDAEHVVAVAFRFSGATLGSPEERQHAVELFQERLRSLPGVRAVSSSGWVPFLGGPSGGPVHMMGRSGLEEPNVGWNYVGEEFFDVLGVPIISGRAFGPADMVEGANTAIISETLARAYWPGEDPVGKRIGTDSEIDKTIVGVAADIRHPGGGGSDQTAEPRALVYLPRNMRPRVMGLVVSVGVRGEPSGLVSAITDIAREVDPGLLATPYLLSDRVRATLEGPRSRAQLVSLLALLAGFLASIGVYGVLSFAVAQRTHEVGIRRALGAPTRTVFASVFKDGMLLIGRGIAVGGVVALGMVAVLPDPGEMLYQTHLADPTILLASALLLGLTGAIATGIPAARAVGMDPGAMLRRA